MSREKVEEYTKELEVFNHETGFIEKTSIKVINYKNKNKVNSYIKKEELSKLAFKFKVPEPKFFSEKIIEDISYYQNSEPFNKIRAPFDKVKRFLIIYMTTVVNQGGLAEYYGEGSAAADNIPNWYLKSYAYEIAHKRARARCLKNALGIDILSDIEIGSMETDSLINDSNSESYEEYIEQEEQEEISPSTDMQRQSIFDIILRKLGKDHKKSDCTLSVFEIKKYLKEVDKDIYNKLIENHIDVPDTTFINKKDCVNFFSFVTSQGAANFFIENGNLSNTVKGKPNKSIENIQKK